MEPITTFRISFFRTIVSIWRQKITIVYWCRDCGKKNTVQIHYNEQYPQYFCNGCSTKNVINLKYR